MRKQPMTMEPEERLAVIVPVAVGDGTCWDLLGDLLPLLPFGSEILLASGAPPAPPAPGEAEDADHSPSPTRRLSLGHVRLRWVRVAGGRAKQMNQAARHTSCRWLWFLHADSRIGPRVIRALRPRQHGCLNYFHLAFHLESAPGWFNTLMRTNAWGAKWRVRFGGMPYGDQGFLLRREVFWGLGGYDELAPYGEDHLLAWSAKRAGIAAHCLAATLPTSARKYRTLGWARTTLRHVRLGLQQAAKPWSLNLRHGCLPPLAAAVFVKTPGLTPLKTRLAAAIGSAAALSFYRQSCLVLLESLRGVESVLGAEGFQAFWAVAEAGLGLEAGAAALVAAQWHDLPIVPQGPGGLGERLHHVYQSLLDRGLTPVLLGADAPQVGLQTMIAARLALASGAAFVLGPAGDGGFYLFAGRRPVPREIWCQVTYSRADTAQSLAAVLAPLGPVAWLPMHTDVDRVEDFSALAADLIALGEGLGAEAQNLLTWLAAGSWDI